MLNNLAKSCIGLAKSCICLILPKQKGQANLWTTSLSTIICSIILIKIA